MAHVDRERRDSSALIRLPLVAESGSAGPVLTAEVRGQAVELRLKCQRTVAIIRREQLRDWLLDAAGSPSIPALNIQHVILTSAYGLTFVVISDDGCYAIEQESLDQLAGAL
jgi:hypothetical protein